MDLRISPRTVQQQTVEKLRAAILAGVFKPGDRLVEADLCEMLGVSRPSVREALRSLEAERLIQIIPNRGPQVPILTWEEAEEIYRVRALLEGEAAALSAVRASDADTKQLRAALAAFGKAVRQAEREELVTSTSDFFGVILKACGNRIIEEVLQGLHARINFLRGRSMSLPGRARFSLEEMTAIYDAILARHPEEARAAAVRHVEQACRSAREAYERDRSDAGA